MHSFKRFFLKQGVENSTKRNRIVGGNLSTCGRERKTFILDKFGCRKKVQKIKMLKISRLIFIQKLFFGYMFLC